MVNFKDFFLNCNIIEIVLHLETLSYDSRVLDKMSVSPISMLKRFYYNVCYAFLVSVTVSLHNFSFVVLTVYLSSPA